MARQEFDDLFNWLYWSGTRSECGLEQLSFTVVCICEIKIKTVNDVLICCWNSASLASLTRETGPQLVKGDPARKADTKVTHVHHHVIPTIAVSDSALKFTHVLYNLSPAGTSPSQWHAFYDDENFLLFDIIIKATQTSSYGAYTGIVMFLFSIITFDWCHSYPDSYMLYYQFCTCVVRERISFQIRTTPSDIVFELVKPSITFYCIFIFFVI